jgi:hypothetical protein
MSSYCVFEDLSDHEKVNCNYRKGGISAVGILKTGHGITDFSNATQTLAAIAAGTLKIIKGIKALYPAATPIEGENPEACGSETILDGFDNTVTWNDFNVTDSNDVFYVELNKSQFSGIVLYYCQEDELRVLEKKVSFVALPAQSTTNKEKQFYAVTAKWTSAVGDPFPELSAAPAGNLYE